MKRLLAFAYGTACYMLFVGTFLYGVGFLGNFVVRKSIDSATQSPLWQALLVDTLLLSVFAVQHSVMARPGFKRGWTRIVQQPVERSTYVLFSSVAMILLYWLWQRIGGVVWDVQHPIGRALLYGLFGAGWCTVLATTFLINHFDLFGMRQVWLYLRGREYTSLGFMTPGPYKWVRHPLYVGWLTAFWATPTMTGAHLVFALGTAAYILVAIRFEERDLSDALPEYAEYRRRVPMLVPRLAGTRKVPAPVTLSTHQPREELAEV